jgi:hypothetical protein
MSQLSNRLRPRLSISISQELHDALTRVRDVTGTSYSGLIDQFLTPSIPLLINIATSVEKIKAGDLSGVSDIQGAFESLDSVLVDSRSALSDVNQQLSDVRKGISDSDLGK